MSAETTPSPDAPIVYLNRKEVEQRCSISGRQIYRLMNAGEFPAACRLSGNCVRWVEAEITAWQASRPRTVEV